MRPVLVPLPIVSDGATQEPLPSPIDAYIEVTNRCNSKCATCQLTFTNDLAVQTSVLTGVTQTAANLCVRMASPVSSSAETVNYTITVVHP